MKLSTMRHLLLVLFIVTCRVSHGQPSPASDLARVNVTTSEQQEEKSDDDGVYKDYTGHALLRITPQTTDDLAVLRTFYESHSPKVDFWREPVALNQSVDVFLSPELRAEAKLLMEQQGMQHHFVFDDIQSLMTVERRRRSTPDAMSESSPIRFDIYRDYDEINQWMTDIPSRCSICEVIEFGTSFENRSMKAIKIGKDDRKPIIWIDAGIHAREWIAPATAIYITEQLIQERFSSDVVRSLLAQFTFVIVPLANPDGYHYTWTKDRLWRKTRSVHPNSKCRGADPNRNWNFHWGGRGTSSNPCSENYRGTHPFSEPEAKAMAELMWQLRERMVVYLSLHSYGQYWLTPWGYTVRVPTDFSDMMEIGIQAINAIKRNYGIDYSLGSSARLLYLAAGGSDDWAKGVAGVKYSYTVELADTGRHGFILPPQYIQSTGRQIFDALQMLATGILAAASRRL